jgi:glucose-6-phosphate-specific signal transduction histidine kinase
MRMARYVLVACLYALGFTVLKDVSVSHWAAFAGFRLSVLLLVPYRYWPALLVGELAALGAFGFCHMEQFGLLWTLLMIVPPIGLAMPVVWVCRERFKLFSPDGSINLAVLIFCTLVVSVLCTLMNLATLSVAKLSPGYQLHYTVSAARWLLGNFLGILTLTPLVLFIREVTAGRSLAGCWRSVVASRLFMETVSVLLPSIALLVWLAIASPAEGVRELAQIAMFLPVVWLSLRHGWHGAALGSMVANIGVVLTMPAKYDLGTLQAQVFIAFAITTMLLLGERIAQLNSGEKREREEAQLALSLAQRSMLAGEMQLRQTSQALEQVREAVQSSYSYLLDRMRLVAPTPEERDIRLKVAITQQQIFRLADSLHPFTWREAGLVAALRQGSIARALDECGIRFWCDVRERGIDVLSQGTQIALYRLMCEAVTLACSEWKAAAISARVRTGVFKGRRWVVLLLDVESGDRAAGAIPADDLAMKLASSGMGLDALRDRVSLFRGRLKVRQLAHHGMRLGLIIRDSA